MKKFYKEKLDEVISKIGLEETIKIVIERLKEIKSQPEQQQDKQLIEVYEEFLKTQTNN